MLADGTWTLLKGVLTMLVIYGVGVLANYLQQRIMIGVSQRALIRIRKDLFDHLQDMPVRYFDTNATGDIMSRFTNDIDMIGELLNNTVIQLISGCNQYYRNNHYHDMLKCLACSSYHCHGSCYG